MNSMPQIMMAAHVVAALLCSVAATSQSDAATGAMP